MTNNLCDKCLNDCKAIRQIIACKNYYNPLKRQFDTRCIICNKRIPQLHKLCNEHNTWLLLLRNLFGISGMLGIIPRFRDIINQKNKGDN